VSVSSPFLLEQGSLPSLQIDDYVWSGRIGREPDLGVMEDSESSLGYSATTKIPSAR
jgi:hypothetical protein